MAGILIYSDNTTLALELLTAAQIIGQDAKVVCINNSAQAQDLSDMGAQVYQIKASGITISDTTVIADCIAQAVSKLESQIVLLASDRRGKELAGRVAQKLMAGCLTDIKALNVNGSKLECVRNSLGGATVVTQSVVSEKQVLAISPKTFKPIEKNGSGSVNDLLISTDNSQVRVVEQIQKGKDDVDIQSAEVLVAVGCGAELEDLPYIKEIADALGGVLACSKPVATDRKWFSEDRIIGLSGKICQPDLALILGISGQVQFTVGIRDARILISINSDENAAMNQMADYYMVADLKEVLPGLCECLKRLSAN